MVEDYLHTILADANLAVLNDCNGSRQHKVFPFQPDDEEGVSYFPFFWGYPYIFPLSNIYNSLYSVNNYFILNKPCCYVQIAAARSKQACTGSQALDRCERHDKLCKRTACPTEPFPGKFL